MNRIPSLYLSHEPIATQQQFSTNAFFAVGFFRALGSGLGGSGLGCYSGPENARLASSARVTAHRAQRGNMTKQGRNHATNACPGCTLPPEPETSPEPKPNAGKEDPGSPNASATKTSSNPGITARVLVFAVQGLGGWGLGFRLRIQSLGDVRCEELLRRPSAKPTHQDP